MHEVELWACVDAEGQYEVGTSAEAARERYENEVGALVDCEGFRMVKVTLKVAVAATAELEGEAPPADGASQLLSVK